MKAIVIIVGLFCFWACNPKVLKEERRTIFTNEKIALDTLRKYEKYDKIEYHMYSDNNDYKVFLDETIFYKVGVIAAERDSIFVFIKKFGSDWKLSVKDNVMWIPHSIELLDLNGDEIKDLKLTNYQGAYDFSYPTVYLLNPKDTTFKHNPHFDLEEIIYEPKTKLVHTHCYVPHVKRKCRYKIVADTLRLVDELRWFQWDYINEEDEVILNKKNLDFYKHNIVFHYIQKGKKQQLYKVVLDKTDSTSEAYTYFLKTLWKTNFYNEY